MGGQAAPPKGGPPGKNSRGVWRGSFPPGEKDPRGRGQDPYRVSMTKPARQRCRMRNPAPVISAIFSLSAGVDGVGNLRPLVPVTTQTRLTSVNRLFSTAGLVISVPVRVAEAVADSFSAMSRSRPNGAGYPVPRTRMVAGM